MERRRTQLGAAVDSRVAVAAGTAPLAVETAAAAAAVRIAAVAAAVGIAVAAAAVESPAAVAGNPVEDHRTAEPVVEVDTLAVAERRTVAVAAAADTAAPRTQVARVVDTAAVAAVGMPAVVAVAADTLVVVVVEVRCQGVAVGNHPLPGLVHRRVGRVDAQGSRALRVRTSSSQVPELRRLLGSVASVCHRFRRRVRSSVPPRHSMGTALLEWPLVPCPCLVDDASRTHGERYSSDRPIATKRRDFTSYLCPARSSVA